MAAPGWAGGRIPLAHDAEAHVVDGLVGAIDLAEGGAAAIRAVVPTAAADEATLFLRLNYASYRLANLLAPRTGREPPARVREMLLWHRRAQDARAALVRANLALVLAMAKRTRVTNVEFSELVAEGNLALLRSIEKLDVSRGFKFSTYACHAILKSFGRLGALASRYRRMFPVDPGAPGLNRTEHKVVVRRFGMASVGEARSLRQVGREIGLTRERVRQIQIAALRKIRFCAGPPVGAGGGTGRSSRGQAGSAQPRARRQARRVTEASSCPAC